MKRFLKYHIKDRIVLTQQARTLKFSREVPILVFTMAKVGSLSVYQSLKMCSTAPVFHIHTLDETEIVNGIQKCYAHGVFPDSRSPVSLLNKSVIQKGRPFKVISLFRNPIERNISAFFDAFEIHMGMSASRYQGNIQTLEDAFYTKVNQQYAIHWYDRHFKNGIGVDVFDIPFDTQKKYKILKNDQCEILLMDSRLTDENKETVIADFCNLKTFELKNVNVTAQLKHAGLYKRFKSHIRFRESYLSEQLDSRYFNHFFSGDDKQKLIEIWKKD